MRRAWLVLLLASCAAAQVLHRDTGDPVTLENPATPGEPLLMIAPERMDEPVDLQIGSESVDWSWFDEARVEFTLPEHAAGSFLEVTLAGVSGTIPVNRADGVQLDAAEVRDLVTRAALALDNSTLVVAVVDRAGRPLAIYRRPQASDSDVETALSLARTGAFFSHNQAPLSSRTVRSLSTINFPEGIPNLPAAALYGIENTNRGCEFNTTFAPGKSVPPAKNAAGTGTGKGITTQAGGLPLYRNGSVMIGGIGVGGVGPDAAEFATVAATFGTPFFVSLPLPPPAAVFVDGIRLPYVFQTTRPAGTNAASAPGGVFTVGPLHGNDAPEEWLVLPKAGATLTADEVRTIIERSIETANKTRAVIRLPLGTRTSMAIGVTDLQGNVLGLYRMRDSTVFSIDVAVAKARNVVYFSGPNADPRDLAGVPPGTAFTNRTIGFGGQPLFPSGILNSTPGPFFDVFQYDLANPCTQGRQPKNVNQSGIVFFPGSAPLYKGGNLVGGLGVSGDGVEQDDYVTAGGAKGFEAPAEKRADQTILRGVRLPYWKFPRNPEQ